MKVIITGATGMIGKGVLLECLDDKRIKEVLLVNRNSLGMEHPKLKEVLLKDFSDPSSIKDNLKGYDVVYFCLGVSAGGMNEEDYTKITYGYTINFAEAYKEVNPEGSFFYVSGQGTDSSEKGRMMWARVKGKTENDLMKMGFKNALMFRPGGIRPMRGIKSRTKSYQRVYNIINPFWGFFEWIMGDSLTNTTTIGVAMINGLVNNAGTKVLEPKDINQFARA
ncbi:MAG: hypothetical protein RL266_1772 [Bacteroidota bacterium]